MAIIGAGPSGLYAAYRLLTGTPRSKSPVTQKPSVAVFEASDRLGGRIWSEVPPGAPHLIAEFGGMRFLQNQEIVPKLISALKLPTVPFSAGNGNNYVYLRGSRFQVSQYSDPSVVPYSLPPAEQGMSPSQLLLKGIETYVPNAPTLSGAEWTKVKATSTYGGELLRDQGYWNLMQSALSPEGYNLVADGVGYPSLAENWNSVEMMQELAGDFAPNALYFTIPGGYMRLPLTLGAMARAAGASIHLSSTAVSIVPDGSGGATITMRRPGGTTSMVTAKRVILTTPLEPLQKLAVRSPMLQETAFQTALGTVGPTTPAKMFLGFPTPWWKTLGIVGGYSITDLPAKRIWYFGTEGEQPGGEASNQNSLLMLYNDQAPAGFWNGYEAANDFNGAPSPRTAPSAMVAAAVAQLSEVHGVPIPQPYWAGFINWENLPYGNGFHWWNVHADSAQVVSYLADPFDAMKVSVVGDCWSPAQNWIESGLIVTERLMQTIYRLEPPPWLPAGTGISP
ncbi:MAG TPA: FAD-dependent oxidoreductase [Acidimicrobiales bacterium]|nr:FAD-dependent oxidoreductase [Acidimicrobiales bacterium]